MNHISEAEILVDSGEVGGGGKLSEKHTISCRFHDFAKLPNKRGDNISSCPLKCHGHEWEIKIYPGGGRKSDEENVYTSVRLALISKSTGDLKVNYRVRAGPKIRESRVTTFTFEEDTWGYSNYALRADVLDPTNGYLDDEGALVVKVDIQIYTKERPVFKPKKKLQIDMLKLLESSDDANVMFSVGDSMFPVHSAILKYRAPTLASIAEDADGTEVDILNVEPRVFRQLLRYIYGDELPSSNDMQRDARSLLEAADRFGCADMKLHVEAEVVRSILSADNSADWVLFADSHCCALLKEAAISVFKSNSEAVMDSSGWAALKESAEIMNDLLQVLVRNKPGSRDDDSNIKNMSVSLLRKELEENGLDVDGTREMLIERLEEARSRSS